MRNLLILLLAFISLKGNSQNINTIDSTDYFSKGMEAFDNNDLTNARIFFLESYEQNPDRNTLYNIGQISLLLNDTCAACKIFEALGESKNDTISKNIYKDICIDKIDSSYYDNKFQPLTSSEKYKYFEEYKKTKCDTITKGIIHKKGHSGTVKFGVNLTEIEKTDIYARYYIQDSVKIYDFVYGVTFHDDNTLVIEKFKKNINTYLNAKYDLSMIKYGDRYLSLYLIIDKTGTIIDGYSYNNPFKDYNIVANNEIVDEIIFSAKRIKDLKPVVFFDNPIYYKFSMSIAF
jgi:hypothetical protein